MRNDNRQWPPPREPWIMQQEWHDLLFAHWALPVEVVRRFVPAHLPLDTFDGKAWVAVTPFTLRGLRPRGLPSIPGLSHFPEINVRTYVKVGGKPGVFFFSLDAGSRLAVLGARLTYRLPYFFTRASVTAGPERIGYRSVREDRRSHDARFEGRYGPAGAVFNAEPGTLEFFLTERYCLYATGSRNRVWRAEIDHAPWPLQPAEADITTNTMARAAGIILPDDAPLLHFSRSIAVRVWRPILVSDDELGGGQASAE
jgi:uncharacterized protein